LDSISKTKIIIPEYYDYQSEVDFFKEYFDSLNSQIKDTVKTKITIPDYDDFPGNEDNFFKEL
jgi:hypothetical protein